MKPGWVLLASVIFLLIGVSQAQRTANAVVYGIVRTSDGKRASNLGLVAMPLGISLNTSLPRTQTNDSGEYRFEHLPWWGSYEVFADDEKAGYSSSSTGTKPASEPSTVEVTTERPMAEFNFSLPPKAGFVQIHLTNRRSGEGIRVMIIAVKPLENPDAKLFRDPVVFTMSCGSDRPVLVPPNRNLLLHVGADGFREWDDSRGLGKPINVLSGDRLNLNVQLEPTE